MVGVPGEVGCRDKVEGIGGYVLKLEFVLECEENEEEEETGEGEGEMVKTRQSQLERLAFGWLRSSPLVYRRPSLGGGSLPRTN